MFKVPKIGDGNAKKRHFKFHEMDPRWVGSKSLIGGLLSALQKVECSQLGFRLEKLQYRFFIFVLHKQLNQNIHSALELVAKSTAIQ